MTIVNQNLPRQGTRRLRAFQENAMQSNNKAITILFDFIQLTLAVNILFTALLLLHVRLPLYCNSLARLV